MNHRVVIKVFGGFGNQLFCYACGYALAKENDCELIIDTSQQDNDIARKVDIVQLKIDYQKRITFKKGKSFLSRALVNKVIHKFYIGIHTKKVIESTPYKYDTSIFDYKNTDIYLDGYWQSYHYFEKYRKDLCEMYMPKIEQSSTAKKIEQDIESHPNSVAIHIRRGDYRTIGCCIDSSYYDKAISRMISELDDNLSFYIFSDDINFANDFIKKYNNLNMKVVKNITDNQTIDDFFIMSKCQNFIIANSSFSWWAAWLSRYNKKIVICPEVNDWTGDFYPAEWIKIATMISK